MNVDQIYWAEIKARDRRKKSPRQHCPSSYPYLLGKGPVNLAFTACFACRDSLSPFSRSLLSLSLPISPFPFQHPFLDLLCCSLMSPLFLPSFLSGNKTGKGFLYCSVLSGWTSSPPIWTLISTNCTFEVHLGEEGGYFPSVSRRGAAGSFAL